MKFPSNKIESAVSTDESRYAWNAVKLDLGAKKLIATDGHILAAVPVQVEAGELANSVLIGTDAIKSIRAIAKRTKYDPDLSFPEGKVVIQNHTERAEHAQVEGDFPQWEKVVPEVTGPPTISFDVNLLVRLADAIRSNQSNRPGTKHVSLWIRSTSDPIVVKSTAAEDSEAIGVLMPVRA